MIDLARCGRPGCAAPILWAFHLRTGGRAPIDADPTADGNILVDHDTGRYIVLAKDELAQARAMGDRLHLNHFVTCANPPGRKGPG